MSSIELFAAEPCAWQLASPASAPLERLHEYLQSFIAPAFHYRVLSDVTLLGNGFVGLENVSKRLIPETLPFQSISSELSTKFSLPSVNQSEVERLRQLSLLPPSHRLEGAVCCLMDLRNWSSSYFHWCIDSLPRVLAAEDYMRRSGERCLLLVPSNMRPWQLESLSILGWGADRLFPIDISFPIRSVAVDRFIACCPRGLVSNRETPWDAMVPAVVKTLSQRLTQWSPVSSTSHSRNRIYLSRGDARNRRVINEDQVMERLSRCGFQRIFLDGMELHDQIALFRSASHVIAPHGAGLTNLLFATNAQVLEIFQSKHGVRPDYFQIASILGHSYHPLVCESHNLRDDIHIELSLLEPFLAAYL